MNEMRPLAFAALFAIVLGATLASIAWLSEPDAVAPAPDVAHRSPEAASPHTEPVTASSRSQAPPVDDGVSGAPPRGSTIRITNLQDRPVPHATVVVFDGRSELRLVGDDAGQVEATLDGVEAVVASAPGFATCSVPASLLARAEHPTIRLPGNAQLQVRVIDNSGNLVEGQRVDAVVEQPLNDENRHLVERTVGYTNGNGIAIFEQLGVAQYWISVPQWRRWSGADLYKVEPSSGTWTTVDARVVARALEQCLEVSIVGLEPPAQWLQCEHPELSVQIEGVSGLERIYPPGIATVFGAPAETIRVRVVRTKAGYSSPESGCTDWQTGVLGQSRPLQFDATRLEPRR